jgi:hypothetical protein
MIVADDQVLLLPVVDGFDLGSCVVIGVDAAVLVDPFSKGHGARG